jgi:phytoene synthase
MRDDLAGAAIGTEAELDVYCYRVAGTVGVVMAAVLGATDPTAPRHAAALGEAMQRTNILRDIDEDLANGRVYLARATLERFGTTTVPPPAAREELLRDQIERADALYDVGVAGIELLPRGRRAIAAAGAMYREILRQIERDGYGAQPGRAIVSRRRKLRVAARARIPERQA